MPWIRIDYEVVLPFQIYDSLHKLVCVKASVVKQALQQAVPLLQPAGAMERVNDTTVISGTKITQFALAIVWSTRKCSSGIVAAYCVRQTHTHK